jgi:hypothetical protein
LQTVQAYETIAMRQRALPTPRLTKLEHRDAEAQSSPVEGAAASSENSKTAATACGASPLRLRASVLILCCHA